MFGVFNGHAYESPIGIKIDIDIIADLTGFGYRRRSRLHVWHRCRTKQLSVFVGQIDFLVFVSIPTELRPVTSHVERNRNKKLDYKTTDQN